MELELKFKVDKDWSAIIAEFGYEFAKQSHQIDSYFLCGDIIEGRNTYLRVREDVLKKEYSFDFHEVLSFLATKETEIDLPDAETAQKMRYILSGMGLKLQCVIDKQRGVYLKDEVKIAVDYVDGLGHFVEVELEGEETSANEERLNKIAESLGLKRENLVTGKGYPDLWIEAHH